MDFFEKLRRRAGEVNKSKRSQAVGLHPNAISSYITKRSMPRADIAAKIALALDVPLSWMLDDSQGWPPPQAFEGKASLADFPTGVLLSELARRWRLEQLETEEAFKRVQGTDWKALAASLPSDKPEKIDARTKLKLKLLADLLGQYERLELRDSLSLAGDLIHDEIAGPSEPLPSELKVSQAQRFVDMTKDEGFLKVYGWLLDNHKALGTSPITLIGLGKVWDFLDSNKRAEALRERNKQKNK